MSLKNIIIEPDPILRQKSEPIENINNDTRNLIDDMLETMYAAPGIGLAAVQVGILKRIVVIDVSKKDQEKKPIHLINPEITFKSKKTSVFEEGCLSLPGYFAEIERPAECQINFIDYNGKKKEIKANGLLSTCIQHEVDHLNGVFIVDRVTSTTKMTVDKTLKAIKKDALLKVKYRKAFVL